MYSFNQTFATLERLAHLIWPAETTAPLGDWLLRASGGVTKRANSVLTVGDLPNDPNWLETSRAFYRESGLPLVLHVSSGSPPELAVMLSAHGLVGHTPCHVMTAATSDITALTQARIESIANRAMVQIELNNAASDDWITTFMTLEGFHVEKRDFYTRLFMRMPKQRAFIRLFMQDEAVACATAVIAEEWAGILNVVVDERHRGQGLGYLLLHYIAEWCAHNGAGNAFLQVVADNRSAVSLYEKSGFKICYDYMYWSDPE